MSRMKLEIPGRTTLQLVLGGFLWIGMQGLVATPPQILGQTEEGEAREEPLLPGASTEDEAISKTDRYFFEAVKQYARGNFIRASRMFGVILEAKPYLQRARVNLAICQYRLGQVDEAKRSVRRVLEAMPHNKKARELWKTIAPDEPYPQRPKYRRGLSTFDLPPGDDFDRNDYVVEDYYTLFYYYSSVDRSSLTSITATRNLAGNSKFLVVRSIDINRPEETTKVDIESPVAKTHGITKVPHLLLLDRKGDVLVEGPKAWPKLFELRDRELFLEKQGADVIELGGGELFPVLELDGTDEIIDVKDYITQDRFTIMEFFSIETEEYRKFVSQVEELVDLRPDLRMIRVNLGTIKLPGRDPQPNFKSPNVKVYGLEDIPYIQIYRDTGQLLQSGATARKQLEVWLGQK